MDLSRNENFFQLLRTKHGLYVKFVTKPKKSKHFTRGKANRNFITLKTDVKISF